jgi:putative ABC transport system ATP-binding protein
VHARHRVPSSGTIWQPGVVVTAAHTVKRDEEITVTVPDGPDTLTILDGADLAIGTGEVVALTGASGSGKSTLLAVAGLLRTPDAGTVTIATTDASALDTRRRARLRRDAVGFVFQSANLFPSLTAVEQVELAAHIAGRLDRGARSRARALLDDVGLGARLGNRPAQLSGGERQRVAIARALMNRPVLLLADEPTAALDDRRGREIMDLLVREGHDNGVATLIVTHNPAQLGGDPRRLHLDGGRVVDDVQPAA